jgi:hypothetical protein
MSWIFPKPKFELVEIKGAFASKIISTKQSKYHQHTSAYKKKS